MMFSPAFLQLVLLFPRLSNSLVVPPTKNMLVVRSGCDVPLRVAADASRESDTVTQGSQTQQWNLNQLLGNESVAVGGICSLCFLIACTYVTWEDHACEYLWPSRHRTMLASSPAQGWGMRTVHGLGFGAYDHESLDEMMGEETYLPSYNEILLEHRQNTVAMWRQSPDVRSDVSYAIHVVVECLQQVRYMQEQSSKYEWVELRKVLRSSPLAELPKAASTLRRLGNADLQATVGFDWGSCAWRHCGALADIQEAADEIDALLGVLEPFEVNFCLDIIERSLRDVLSEVPWSLSSPVDHKSYSDIPEYEPKVKVSVDGMDVNEEYSRFDGDYLKILQTLRID